MRVTSTFWVAAKVRQANGAGAFAVVARRGATEAGAIFVKVVHGDGACDLYAPAPQAMFDADAPTDRRFEKVITRGEEAAVDARLTRERDFDPDLWVVAIEDREGRAFLEE